jgi:hypothetical protein
MPIGSLLSQSGRRQQRDVSDQTVGTGRNHRPRGRQEPCGGRASDRRSVVLGIRTGLGPRCTSSPTTDQRSRAAQPRSPAPPPARPADPPDVPQLSHGNELETEPDLHVLTTTALEQRRSSSSRRPSPGPHAMASLMNRASADAGELRPAGAAGGNARFAIDGGTPVTVWGGCLGVRGDAGEEPVEPGLESELVVVVVQQARGAEGGEVREVARVGEAL